MNEEQKNMKEGNEIIKLFGVQIGGQRNELSKLRSNQSKNTSYWSADEHRSFLEGLEKLGRGDWKGIAENFVPSRTPAQIGSHAQKYFIKQDNKMKRRRTSVFDIPPSHRPSNADVESKNATQFQEHTNKPANLAMTTSKKPPLLAQENGSGIYQQASLSSSRKGYPTRILVPGWIAVDNYSNKGSDILGFVAPPFAVQTTNNIELNNNGKFLCETDCEKVLCEMDSNNGKFLSKTVLCEPQREKVTCETCRKPVSCEMSNKTD